MQADAKNTAVLSFIKIVKKMQILSPTGWKDYELIDCGDFEKLERFGEVILRRPEPKAIWEKSLSIKEWTKMCFSEFKNGAGFGKSGKEDSGSWNSLKKIPQNWKVVYNYKKLQMVFCPALTSFKHVGIFPEQAPNWNFIYDSVQSSKVSNPKVLNLFAYTGGASLAAKAAGADVTHLDSVKQVVSWARKNMESSHLDNIRWVIDDALKFVKRESKRGNLYHGIMLDPPAYGHGTDGEKWKLDENILEMMKNCKTILQPENSFIILNLYSNGFSSLVADTLCSSIFSGYRDKEFGELVLVDNFGKKLPLSVFSRLIF